MFWNHLVKLCNQKSTTPNAVCLALGLSGAAATKWRNGAVPRDTTLKKIADYFGVSVDYLLGKEQEKKTPSKVLSPSFPLTPRETAVLIAYRTHPSEQPAVDKLLDVPTTPEEIILYNVAYFGDKSSEGVVTMSTDEWEELKNTPTTDQDLS